MQSFSIPSFNVNHNRKRNAKSGISYKLGDVSCVCSICRHCWTDTIYNWLEIVKLKIFLLPKNLNSSNSRRIFFKILIKVCCRPNYIFGNHYFKYDGIKKILFPLLDGISLHHFLLYKIYFHWTFKMLRTLLIAQSHWPLS